MTDSDALASQLMFRSMQLGFIFERMATGDLQIQTQEWQSNIKFICNVGHMSWYNRNNYDRKVRRLFQPCTCFARYKRCDEDDERSPYILVEYNIAHTHELNFKISNPKLQDAVY